MTPGTNPVVEVTSVGAEAAEEVYAVVRAAFADRPPLDPPADALGETPETIARALGRSRGLLARSDGRPVGATLLDRRGDSVFLRRFGVDPRAQGQRVASLLLEAAGRHVPGQRRVGVLARPELPATVDFWRAKGFEDGGTVGPCLQLWRDLPTRHEVRDAEAMRDLGWRTARLLEPGDLLMLSGELGAGKTTFTQGLGEGLGVRGGITSPTFVIARVHPSLVGGPDLVHVDAYRLGGIEELDDLDLDTALDEAVTVVEWGAGLAEGLAERRLEVRITRALGGETTGDAGHGAVPGDLADHDPRVVELHWVEGR
ncbi:tRNA (adenosine(37)-N6)-threonylcarbamoyltransferase complex ATPase subunit type 1 TsaE [Nocardioides sp. Y6]|uniref:tRNA threonylcarbamoyladenosine biosynthesis protein TsaE n=1 Tax=Nocardioides malaquae TaxID=2773426 RepID=A0ABR9RTL2_9ACTN|nr:tRNA (adenosine(37)-N6)-threonylcarbamoyltransferase complex ATPase subunit type 1 TsaE [Nocardioides malaquae]MBE7324925.1 tRNA (adenosine(37)-N6)-threonylcarbamoyltransferase complex ATPase subunit type 1 TsaE [Nocardioides malaquae]